MKEIYNKRLNSFISKNHFNLGMDLMSLIAKYTPIPSIRNVQPISRVKNAAKPIA